MKLSVCMATRNGEQYVREQLESILAQLGSDDEVVISDDSSTDRTVEILTDFGDARIRLFRDNTYFSPIFNFENALSKATGDVIALSDQDDIWLDNKVSVIKESFRQNRFLVHLIVMDGYVIDQDGKVTDESIFRKIRSGAGLVKNIYDNTYLGCSMAFTRSLMDIALPFPRKIPMHDMWLGLLADIFGSVDFVAEKTMRYRKHRASITDFRREFKPILQISRRMHLSWYLLERSVARWRLIRR